MGSVPLLLTAVYADSNADIPNRDSSTVAAIYTTAHAFSFGGAFSQFHTMKWHVNLWLFSGSFSLRYHYDRCLAETEATSLPASAADIIITAAMVYYLRGAKSSFDRTNRILNTLIKNVIETNALTCVVAIVSFGLMCRESVACTTLTRRFTKFPGRRNSLQRG